MIISWNYDVMLMKYKLKLKLKIARQSRTTIW